MSSSTTSNASRRNFLQTGTAATALLALNSSSAQAQSTTTLGAIPTPAPGPVTNPVDPVAAIGTLAAPDIAIFRFAIANELIGGDLWSQYANQVLYNPSFTAALRAIDPMLPRYVLDTVRDELSHGLFFTALASALRVEPVNLDPFRTLPDAGAAALTTYGQTVTDPQLMGAMAGLQSAGLTLPLPGTRRLVNLTALNIDTSWFNKYRTASNPDVQGPAPQLAEIRSQPTIPTTASTSGTGTVTADTQLLANAALMHMSLSEQTESSTYLALGAFLRNRELLGLMSSILPVEMMHYTTFQTSLAMLQAAGTGAGAGTPPPTSPGAPGLGQLDLRSQRDAIPLPILPAPAPVYAGLPNVSVIRPRRTVNAGAVATAQRLVAANYFGGQPPAFLDMMTQMARAADAATTLAELGPKGLSTVQPEVTLSTGGSLSGSATPLTYSLRAISGVASIIGANTPTPRVQFAGGSGAYTFELTVTDALGNSSTDVTTIIYNGR